MARAAKLPPDFLVQASLALATSVVEDVDRTRQAGRQNKSQRPPPPVAVRATVLIQACMRRKEFFRSFGGMEGMEDELADLAPPQPLVATALYFARRLRNPSFLDVDPEATAVAGLLSGRPGWGPNKLKMGEAKEVLRYYEGAIPANHIAMRILEEKLDKLVVEAQEYLYEECEKAGTPLEVKTTIETIRKQYEIPVHLEDRVMEGGRKRMVVVKEQTEAELRGEFSKCTSVPEFDALRAEVDRLFGDVETDIRAEIETARTRRIQFLEQELQTKWSRPFVGPLPPHTRAAKRYALELGSSNPKVKEFKQEERRHASNLEAEFDVEVSRMQAQVRALTKRRKEARARSMIEDLDDKISAKMGEVSDLMEKGITELGADNEKVAKHARDMLSHDAHATLYVLLVERAAEELRSEILLKDPRPEAADRIRSCTAQLYHLLQHLGSEHPLQEAMHNEFTRELRLMAEAEEAQKKFVEERELTGMDYLRMAAEQQAVSDEAGRGREATGRDLPGATEADREMKDLPPEESNAAGSPSRRQAQSEHEALLMDLQSLEKAEVDADSPPLTEREPEEEDLWADPAAFKAVESAPHTDVVVERKPLGGLGDLPPPGAAAVAPTEQIGPPDAKVVQLFSGFGPDDDDEFRVPGARMVSAQVVMKDLTMDVVKLHTEPVFSAKFIRAVAESVGVDRKRIKVVGFESGSVKVLLQVTEPGPQESGAMSATDVVTELTRQVEDAGSSLRTGEMGPFLASAVVERNIAERTSAMAIGSMGGAYSAPPMEGTAKPGKPKDAWQATVGASSTQSTRVPDGGTMQSAGLTSGTWGASRMDMRVGARSGDTRVDPTDPIANDQTFRTTCPRAEGDETGQKWAMPYEPQQLYKFYDKHKEDAAKTTKADQYKGFTGKQKFASHAQFETFKLTRHPIGGTEKLKGFKLGEASMGAAKSWIDSAEGRQNDPLRQTLAKELAQAKEGLDMELTAPGKDDGKTPISDDSQAGSPGRKEKKKGRKKGGQANLELPGGDTAEPDAEPGLGTPSSASASPSPPASSEGRRRHKHPTGGSEGSAASPSSKDGGKDGGDDKDETVKPKKNRRASASSEQRRASREQQDKDKTPTSASDGFDADQDADTEVDKTASDGMSKRQRRKAEREKREKDSSPPRSPDSGDAKSTEHSRRRRSAEGRKVTNDPADGRRGAAAPIETSPDRSEKDGKDTDKTSKKEKRRAKSESKLLERERERERQEKEAEKERDLSNFLEGAAGPEASVCWAGMHGGMPGTGLRAVAELGNRLPAIGRPSVDDLRSPAYVREQYRYGTVTVGPPYHTNEKDMQGSPAWTAYQLLDATLDKNDWKRSYSNVTKKPRGGQLGPRESVRQMGRSVSLPRLRVGVKAKQPPRPQQPVRPQVQRPQVQPTQPQQPQPTPVQEIPEEPAVPAVQVDTKPPPSRPATGPKKKPPSREPRKGKEPSPARDPAKAKVQDDEPLFDRATTPASAPSAEPSDQGTAGTAIADAIDPSSGEEARGSTKDARSGTKGDASRNATKDSTRKESKNPKAKAKRQRKALKGADKDEHAHDKSASAAESSDAAEGAPKLSKKEKKEQAKKANQKFKEEEERKKQEAAEAERQKALEAVKAQMGDQPAGSGWEAGTEAVTDAVKHIGPQVKAPEIVAADGQRIKKLEEDMQKAEEERLLRARQRAQAKAEEEAIAKAAREAAGQPTVPQELAVPTFVNRVVGRVAERQEDRVRKAVHKHVEDIYGRVLARQGTAIADAIDVDADVDEDDLEGVSDEELQEYLEHTRRLQQQVEELRRQLNVEVNKEQGPAAGHDVAEEAEGAEQQMETLSFLFPKLDYDAIDHGLFKKDLLAQFRRCDVSESAISQMKLELRPGSVIVDIAAPPPVIEELRQKLAGKRVAVMGSSAQDPSKKVDFAPDPVVVLDSIAAASAGGTLEDKLKDQEESKPAAEPESKPEEHEAAPGQSGTVIADVVEADDAADEEHEAAPGQSGTVIADAVEADDAADDAADEAPEEVSPEVKEAAELLQQRALQAYERDIAIGSEVDQVAATPSDLSRPRSSGTADLARGFVSVAAMNATQAMVGEMCRSEAETVAHSSLSSYRPSNDLDLAPIPKGQVEASVVSYVETDGSQPPSRVAMPDRSQGVTADGPPSGTPVPDAIADSEEYGARPHSPSGMRGLGPGMAYMLLSPRSRPRDSDAAEDEVQYSETGDAREPSKAAHSDARAPSKLDDSGDRMPSKVEDEGDRMPSKFGEGSSRMPSKVEDSGDRTASKFGEGSSRMPSKVEDSGDRMPSKFGEGNSRMPSKVEDSGDRMPSKFVEPIDSLPSEAEDSGDRMPSKVVEPIDRLPSKAEDSGDRMPSKVVEPDDRLPSKADDGSGRVPSKVVDSTSHVPSEEDDNSARVPSKAEDSSARVPSKLERRPDSPTRRAGFGPGMAHLLPTSPRQSVSPGSERPRRRAPTEIEDWRAPGADDSSLQERQHSPSSPSAMRGMGPGMSQLLLSPGRRRPATADVPPPRTTATPSASSTADLQRSQTQPPPVTDSSAFDRPLSPSAMRGMGPGMGYMLLSPRARARSGGTPLADEVVVDDVVADARGRSKEADRRRSKSVPLVQVDQQSEEHEEPAARELTPRKRSRSMPAALSRRLSGMGPGISQMLLSTQFKHPSADDLQVEDSSSERGRSRTPSKRSVADLPQTTELEDSVSEQGRSRIPSKIPDAELPQVDDSAADAADPSRSRSRSRAPTKVYEPEPVQPDVADQISAEEEARAAAETQAAADAAAAAAAAAAEARARERTEAMQQAAAARRRVTNSGATRQQVHSFAQTLTGNIFKQSQSVAARRSAADLARTAGAPGMASTSAAARRFSPMAQTQPGFQTTMMPAGQTQLGYERDRSREPRRDGKEMSSTSWSPPPHQQRAAVGPTVPSLPLETRGSLYDTRGLPPRPATTGSSRSGFSTYRSGPRSPIPADEDAFFH